MHAVLTLSFIKPKLIFSLQFFSMVVVAPVFAENYAASDPQLESRPSVLESVEKESWSRHWKHRRNRNATKVLIDYRNLNEGPDGVLIMEMDPESRRFGKVLSNLEIGDGVLPHHIYFNPDESRVYTTALGGSFLYELIIEYKKSWHRSPKHGRPKLKAAIPIDTGENRVGEDQFFTRDNERYFVTFMGGVGVPRSGSIGVFDAPTNQLIKTITAPISENPDKFILYPHGISVDEDKRLMMVTSTVSPDLTEGVGNTVTLLDMDSYELKRTYLVADGPEDLSAPVEVLLMRGQYPAYALANTMFGGDVWGANYNPSNGTFDEFSKIVDGSEQGMGWALEFYVGPGDNPYCDDDQYLYISFADPGRVVVYDISSLPTLREVRTIEAEKGAHHMTFFRTRSGREVIAIQNNLLNLDGLNAGTITVADIHTGEVLATADPAGDYGLMPESVEWLLGRGHYLHH